MEKYFHHLETVPSKKAIANSGDATNVTKIIKVLVRSWKRNQSSER